MKLHIVLSLTFTMLCACQLTNPQNFADKQRRYPRVRAAFEEKDGTLRSLFADQDIPYPPQKLFIRVFKQEKILEVWAFSTFDAVFKLVKHYPICRTSGNLGPKRREGDLQIPEGFYYIDRFNPKSNFHLSLGVNYPNQADKILGKKGNLGGDIFIHGGCATIGCVPITDEYIKEVYWLAVQAKSNGYSKILVHIFPTKLDDHTMTRLKNTFPNNNTLINFWKNLKIGYNWFEQYQKLPMISINRDGTYQFSDSSEE
ncbi:MAG: L,D-transpeptidase family protein [Candidatus Poribacteria bacterium]|nr:L,D-transpeptidase family protein [Candidatus Poribacteria bacterium]